MHQWFVKTTEYAEELSNDLNELKIWANDIRESQRNWLGISFGSRIKFNIYNHQNLGLEGITKKTKILTQIECYTIEPETIFGVTFIAINLDHKFISETGLLNDANFNKKYNDFISNEHEQGLLIEGYTAVNPISFTDRMPIYISKYIGKDARSGNLTK